MVVTTTGQPAYDPVLVLATVLRLLADDRVPVSVRSYDRSLESAQRLLRDLGVEALDGPVLAGPPAVAWPDNGPAAGAAYPQVTVAAEPPGTGSPGWARGTSFGAPDDVSSGVSPGRPELVPDPGPRVSLP